jgi:hypothetical protein
LLVQTFFHQVLFRFLKEIVLIKFWWNNEKLKFCSKNPAIFQKKNLKNQEEVQDFLIFSFVILDSCLTNVHTQKPILEQKMFMQLIKKTPT